MDGRMIYAERERLDHQRARLEEILAADMVSPMMRNDLRYLLDDIGRRLWELSSSREERGTLIHQ